MTGHDPRLDMGRAALITQLDEATGASAMTDDEHEAAIRKAHDDSRYYAMSPAPSPNEVFLLRRLDEVRGERNGWGDRCQESEAKVSELAIKLNEARTEIARLREGRPD